MLSARRTTPERVPVAPCGAAVTAASAFSFPSPQTLLFPASPPHVVLFTSVAVWSRSVRVRATSPLSSGEIDQTRATVPATCGDAIEVPLMLP
jgi:hypothetical protein